MPVDTPPLNSSLNRLRRLILLLFAALLLAVTIATWRIRTDIAITHEDMKAGLMWSVASQVTLVEQNSDLLVQRDALKSLALYQQKQLDKERAENEQIAKDALKLRESFRQ